MISPVSVFYGYSGAARHTALFRESALLGERTLCIEAHKGHYEQKSIMQNTFSKEQ